MSIEYKIECMSHSKDHIIARNWYESRSIVGSDISCTFFIVSELDSPLAQAELGSDGCSQPLGE